MPYPTSYHIALCQATKRKERGWLGMNVFDSNSMLCQVVSNITDPVELFIEPEMTVGEVRALVAEMTVDSNDWNVRLTFQGHTLEDDEETWSSVTQQYPVAQGVAPKLFSHASKKREEKARPPVSLPLMEEQKDRQQAKLMEPIIDTLVNDPNFSEMMISGQPSLRRLIDANPEVGRLFRNPETLKSLIMSQIDPDQRRAMNRNVQLQLAQISAIPGGEQLLERYTSGLMDDMDLNLDLVRNTKTKVPEDEKDDNSESVRGVNSEALPNPWSQSTNTADSGNTNTFSNAAMNLFGIPGNVGHPSLGNLFGSGLGGPFPFMSPGISIPQTGVTASQRGDDATRWSQQLAMLKDMGFMDEELCLEALRMTNGDVDMAVNFIVNKDSS
ncbi:hypothetical protein, conserved [Trypanosoma brucei gambiense DAL972]|uniref:UBA domain-containing protein n=2 Tax=Trypanosoma brucei TaxID=5691 RepID=D0A5S0_TRYB9|nr:hypothetical protein, conserved [Trypanosoma brucei gambiense DAL972]CBH17021.1 hypothetical protein, conserved [Trypanosoma brucei gambiense DAL972]|eukprot:XP_011779285.1 hypothetical protein, conserved [Trypanosoma brucei gambiense DAL972]